MGCPAAASAASIRASGNVGCGCIVNAISSMVAPISIARAASDIISDAEGPITCTPTTLLLTLSQTTFTKPSVSPAVRALPNAANGNLVEITSRPDALAILSVRPAEAISGSVNIASGTVFHIASLGNPAATSAATIPSFDALCASTGGALT